MCLNTIWFHLHSSIVRDAVENETMPRAKINPIYKMQDKIFEDSVLRKLISENTRILIIIFFNIKNINVFIYICNMIMFITIFFFNLLFIFLYFNV